eukprot:6473487-Pyramimonas_sp.AAC.1
MADQRWELPSTWSQIVDELASTQVNRTPGSHRHAGGVTALVLSRDERRFYSAGGDGIVRCWDALEGGCIQELHGHLDAISVNAL